MNVIESKGTIIRPSNQLKFEKAWEEENVRKGKIKNKIRTSCITQTQSSIKNNSRTFHVTFVKISINATI